jgi:hypothetical protein
MRRTELEEKNSKSKALSVDAKTSDFQSGFVVCVKNSGYPVSLEVGKIYQTLPDASAGTKGFLRVVDESGEDYLHPRSCFLPVHLSKAIKEALQLAS